MSAVESAAATVRPASATHGRTVRVLLFFYVASIPIDALWTHPLVGSWNRVVGAALLAALLLSLAMRRTARRGNEALWIGLMLLAWIVASYAWSVDRDLTRTRLVAACLLYIEFWLLWQVVRDERDLGLVVSAFGVGGVVAALVTIGTFLSGTPALTHWGVARYAAFGVNANDLGLTLVLAVPGIAFVGIGARSLRVGALAASAIVILLFAVMLTGSRGAAIAAVPALAYLGVSTFGRVRRPAVVGLVATTAVLVVLVLPRIPADLLIRILSSPTEIRGGTIGLRRSLWEAGVDLWANHPLLGVGAGAAPSAIQSEGLLFRADVIHNTPLSIGAELGTVGFLLFSTLLATLAVRLRSRPRRVQLFALALLATWFVGSLTLTWEYEKSTWLVLGIVLASSGIQVFPRPVDRVA